MDKIEIQPGGPVTGTIRPPGSKSITNRALVCAALAEGDSLLAGALASEDTEVMIESLGRLGIAVEHDRPRATVRVTGCGGTIPVDRADLFVGNSGTSMRFLAAMVALGHGRYRLDGVARMRERPIADLLAALEQLGAKTESTGGCPPAVIHAGGLRGGTVRIAADISSQFLSGLLMAAPYAAGEVEIALAGPMVSETYVTMTRRVMAEFGVAVSGEGPFRIAPGRYRGRQYAIEPDASAASYFFAAAAITGGEVTVAGLSRRSLQGDVAFCDCLARMGCEVRYDDDSITVRGGPLRGIDCDMNTISDTAQTLAAVALFAQGPTNIANVAHIRHKETDRILALANELRKLGATVDERHDGLTIEPGPLHGAEIETYRDHRMAMSFALVGLRTPGVVILDPGCTAKTYPDFFEDLARLRRATSR